MLCGLGLNTEGIWNRRMWGGGDGVDEVGAVGDLAELAALKRGAQGSRRQLWKHSAQLTCRWVGPCCVIALGTRRLFPFCLTLSLSQRADKGRGGRNTPGKQKPRCTQSQPSQLVAAELREARASSSSGKW